MTSTSSSPYSQSSETFANHATSTAFIPPHDRTQSGPTQPSIAELHAEIEDLLKANAAESQAVHRRCAAMIAWADRGMNRADKPSEDLKDYYVRE